MSYCINPQCQNPQNPTHAISCQSCGFQLRLKDRYRLIKVLGQSSCNRTFLAVDEDKPSQPRCIIKQFIASPAFANPSEVASLTIASEFRQYVTELDKIGNHPYIPELLASFQEKGDRYLVQEYILGRNLADELDQEGVFQELQIWHLLSEILPILQTVHNKGIVHGDIKPENIIRRPPSPQTQGKQLFLVDFGGVNPLINSGTSPCGSAEYAAPEQISGEISPKSDLYSLGVTCIHLLTGMSPFDLLELKTNTWVWGHFLKKPVSHRLSRILDKLIQRNPNKRYQSVADVIQDIKSGPIPVPLKMTRQQKWVLTAWGGAALALLSLWMSSRLPSPVPQISSQPLEPIYQIPDPQFPPPDMKRFDAVLPEKAPAVQTLLQNLGPIWSLAMSPDGQFAAYGNTDGTIHIIDAETGGLINTLSGHSQPVGTLAISADGRTLVSGSGDKNILVWDLWSGRLKKILYGHEGWVYAVAISPDGETIASVSRDQTIRLWDMYTGQKLRTLRGYGEDVQSIAFSPDNQTLISGASNGVVELWNWHTGQLLRTVQAHSEAIWSVAVSPDGQTLATGSWDHTVKLWDVNQLQSMYFSNVPQQVLFDHTDKVQSVTFSPDGQTLASGDFGGTVKLWDVTHGGLKGTLKGHRAWVNVVFNPRNNTLISGSFDDTLKRWQLLY